MDPLRRAIKEGDFDAVRMLLSRLGSARASSATADDLLAIAVQDYNTSPKHDGHLKIIDLLIARGAKPRWWMLFEPARTGSQAIVDRLIAGGAELNIFTVAAIGDPSRAARLLRRDPGVAQARTAREIHSYRDFTPLHVCCFSALGRGKPQRETRFTRTAKLLVEHDADVNATATFYGSLTVTPLDMLAHTGSNIALAEYLIEQGASMTALGFLEAISHRGRSLDAGLALAEVFLRRGFDINSPHDDGTVLHRAANVGNAQVVEWLLVRGARVNARGRMGRTPLHLAAERNRSSGAVQALLKAGARRDVRDDSGMTPLDVARAHGRSSLLSWLM